MPFGPMQRARPTSSDRLHALFAGDELPEDTAVKRARITAMALLHTSNPRMDTPVQSLLRGVEEKGRYREYTRSRLDPARPKASVCRFCEVAAAVSPDDVDSSWSPPLNHGARINTSFDHDTNVSRASVTGFQMFASNREQAQKLLDLAHPFHWTQADGSLFKESIAAKLQPKPRWVRAKEQTRADWRAKKQGYLYESVSWAWNEFVSASVENILRITSLTDEVQRKAGPVELSYQYALEQCLGSNFGVAFESGGLDVDNGGYAGRAVAIDNITERDVPIGAEYHLGMNDKAEEPKGTLGRLRGLAKRFQETSGKAAANGDGPYLVTLEASKALRYTMPKNGPDEFRAVLNWTSPALLFTFLSLSICQPPSHRL
jgi:hypothetical protein